MKCLREISPIVEMTVYVLYARPDLRPLRHTLRLCGYFFSQVNGLITNERHALVLRSVILSDSEGSEVG